MTESHYVRLSATRILFPLDWGDTCFFQHAGGLSFAKQTKKTARSGDRAD